MVDPLFKVTSGSRTAKECEVKWLGDRHPNINHAQWSQPEISKCRVMVDAYRVEHGPGVTVDWVWVANELKVMSSKSLTLKAVCLYPVRLAERLWTVCGMRQLVKPTFGPQNLTTRFWKPSRSTV